MRDHRRFDVFNFADRLAIKIYRQTGSFPQSERYGLRSQLRRGAVSTAVNIVEGCGRRSEADFDRFLDIALGSAREVDYLIDLSHRLGLLADEPANRLATLSAQLNGSLVNLVHSRASFRRNTKP